MEFLVIAYALLAFALTSVALSSWGTKMDQKSKRISMVQGKKENPFYDDLDKSFFVRFIKPAFEKMKAFFAKYAKSKNKNQKNAQTKSLSQQLRLAGLYMEVSEFQFIKTMALIIGSAVGVILFIVVPSDSGIGIKLLCLLGGVLVGYAGPTLYLTSRVKSYQDGIRKQLADALDLLSVCIEAGLSFDSALLKISEKLSGPFINELLIVYREIQMGLSRREAMTNLANNSNIEELKTFASALVQADQLGIPINNIMQVQSKQLRTTRSQQAKEKGMKASIKMIIPMLIFIFPVIFIIILGPTLLDIADSGLL